MSMILHNLLVLQKESWTLSLFLVEAIFRENTDEQFPHLHWEVQALSCPNSFQLTFSPTRSILLLMIFAHSKYLCCHNWKLLEVSYWRLAWVFSMDSSDFLPKGSAKLHYQGYRLSLQLLFMSGQNLDRRKGTLLCCFRLFWGINELYRLYHSLSLLHKFHPEILLPLIRFLTPLKTSSHSEGWSYSFSDFLERYFWHS